MSSTTRLTSRISLIMRRGDLLEQVVRQAGPVGGHRVVGGDRADRRRRSRRSARRPGRPPCGSRAGRRSSATGRGRARRRGSPPGGSHRTRGACRASPGDLAPDDPDPEPRAGKGWRQTIRSGSPSSAPTARTSSLNSARRGSTSSNVRSSGRPPTLWCVLIVAAPVPPPDSITSEYERALDEELRPRRSSAPPPRRSG